MILLQNTRALLDTDFKSVDILIKDGKIQKIASKIPFLEKCKRIDCSGAYLLPGGIDIHTHIDDTIGAFELADTYTSASKIALLFGITSLYTFITQGLHESLQESIQKVVQKAEKKSFCDYGYHLTPTIFNKSAKEELRKIIESGYKSIKLYTTYKDAGIFSSYEDIKSFALNFKDLDPVILVHCEDETTLEKYRKIDFTSNSAFTHTKLRPEDVEIEAIRNIIEIANETGIHFHIVHVSTSKGLEKIHKGKESAKLSCETGPQYLLLNEEKLKESNGYAYLCTPPLRKADTAKTLADYAKKGLIDLFATDHCAFTKEDKSRYKNNFQTVPKGLPGIGSLIPGISTLYDSFSEENLKHLAKHISENPAKLTGNYPSKGSICKGADADLILISESSEAIPFRSSLSDSPEVYNELFHHLDFKLVIAGGKIMVKNNRFIYDKEPRGKNLCQK